MLKRRNAIVAFLLVAVLLLGVGYAALADTLIINGTATAEAEAIKEQFDGAVYFSACTAFEKATNKTESFTTETDTVEFEATAFKQVGDTATITYQITNTHPDLNAVIAKPVITSGEQTFTSDYFTVTTDWDDVDNKTVAKKANDVAGTETVTVTVELIKAPQNVDGESVTFALTFEVESAE